MNNSNNYHDSNVYISEADLLKIERVATPNSAKLQRNILKLTQELPQYTESSEAAKVYNLSTFMDKVGLKKVNFWNGFKPYAATIAAGFAVIALSSTLWLPEQNDPIVVVNDYSNLTAEELAEEIAWQELLLLQDELGFAGL